MKIALNATLLRPGQMGGMETYFRNLLVSLQAADAENRYTVLCDARHIGGLPVSSANFNTASCNYSRPSVRWFLRGVIRNTLKVDILRPAMNRLEVDLIHHPFSFLNPLRVSTPSVLTFHDMQHEFYPEFFSPYEMRVRKEFYRPSAQQATRIIAISEHAKSCLVSRYLIPPEKISVIYNGYNQEFRVVEDRERLEQVRSRYGLHRPFLYYPAATWPHKNHKTLLAALKLLKERCAFDGQLVLTGIAMRANGEIMQEIARLGLLETVKVLGFLPHEDLPCLYNLARLLVFPSLFEGFGIPLAEAMACGCPVACSDVTSIPEVIGAAGLTFDPTSPEDIADKVFRLWSDQAEREKCRALGLQRAKLFSWDAAAAQTMEVYRQVGAGR